MSLPQLETVVVACRAASRKLEMGGAKQQVRGKALLCVVEDGRVVFANEEEQWSTGAVEV